MPKETENSEFETLAQVKIFIMYVHYLYTYPQVQ